MDKAFRRCLLSKLQSGENEILLSCNYTTDMELENIYLEGEFGVSRDRSITALPEKLEPGSWTEQGLKHYCGGVTYRMSYYLEAACPEEKGRIWMRLPKLAATCVRLCINGAEKPLPWGWEQDIAIEELLCPGENTVELQIIGSPRNMLGPFHVKSKPTNTNDASFCPTGDKYSSEYLLTPYGILGSIRIVRSK